MEMLGVLAAIISPPKSFEHVQKGRKRLTLDTSKAESKTDYKIEMLSSESKTNILSPGRHLAQSPLKSPVPLNNIMVANNPVPLNNIMVPKPQDRSSIDDMPIFTMNDLERDSGVSPRVSEYSDKSELFISDCDEIIVESVRDDIPHQTILDLKRDSPEYI